MTASAVVFALAIAAAFGFFLRRRLKEFLRYFQQEEYDGVRFLRWVLRAHGFDRRVSIALVVVVLVTQLLSEAARAPAGALAICALFVVNGVLGSDPTATGKKPLVLTARARRILRVAIGLGVAAALLVAAAIASGPRALLFTGFGIAMLVQAAPLMLVAANGLLRPVENAVQRRIVREAKAAFEAVSPTVIGITGSFGKTSTKQFLGHILSAVAPTLATPGSVNTLMGIARVIRESLDRRHRYFLVEMGAYGRGSISRLCALTPPDLAIITAIGAAHLERFGSLENVARAKFEIADASRARGGKLVLNGDAIDADVLRRYAGDPAATFVVAGIADGSAAFQMSAARQTGEGVVFDISHEGGRHEVRAPVYGTHHAANLALAFAAAVVLGVPADTAVAALRTVAQSRHRLEVTRTRAGVTVIDDSYNSNPDGFVVALELLAFLAGDSGRRILVTPGMVELGSRHDADHERVGRAAGDLVDVALVIRPERIHAFGGGFDQGGRAGKELLTFADFAAAKAWVDRHVQPGDAVLFENDLPDLYEADFRL